MAWRLYEATYICLQGKNGITSVWSQASRQTKSEATLQVYGELDDQSIGL